MRLTCEAASEPLQVSVKELRGQPRSSEDGTCKTVQARRPPCLSDKSPMNLQAVSSFIGSGDAKSAVCIVVDLKLKGLCLDSRLVEAHGLRVESLEVMEGLQGYLAHKKPRPPRTLQWDYAYGPRGGAFSHERGTPVGSRV
jgi:hypothetical protein